MREGNSTTGNIQQVSTGYIQVANGTTAQRPSSPAAGMIRWNTTLGGWDTHDGSSWTTHKFATMTGADGLTSEKQMFVYDTTRTKWLSATEHHLFYTDTGVANDDFINYANYLNASVGTLMPYNGTVVGMSIFVLDMQKSSRSVSIYRDLTEIATGFVIGTATTDGQFTDAKTNLNVDFNAGEYIRIRMRYAAGTNTQWSNMLLNMYYRWRV